MEMFEKVAPKGPKGPKGLPKENRSELERKANTSTSKHGDSVAESKKIDREIQRERSN